MRNGCGVLVKEGQPTLANVSAAVFEPFGKDTRAAFALCAARLLGAAAEERCLWGVWGPQLCILLRDPSGWLIIKSQAHLLNRH